MGKASEKAFQHDILQALLAAGWQHGKSADYDREKALYTVDLLAYVQETQPEQWAKFAKLNPKNPFMSRGLLILAHYVFRGLAT